MNHVLASRRAVLSRAPIQATRPPSAPPTTERPATTIRPIVHHVAAEPFSPVTSGPSTWNTPFANPHVMATTPRTIAATIATRLPTNRRVIVDLVMARLRG